MSAPESFVHLDLINYRIVSSFAGLLSLSDSSFRDKYLDEQQETVEHNLTAILENPDAAVLVRYNPDNVGTVDKAIITNVVQAPPLLRAKGTSEHNTEDIYEAWMDIIAPPATESDIDTLVGIKTAHAILRKRGDTQTVRLTPSYHYPADNPYAKLGYVEGGQVWRANDIRSALAPDTKTGTEQYSIDASTLFVPVSYITPERRKAVLYGPRNHRAGTPDLMSGLAVAHALLKADGITTARYFSTDKKLSRRLGTALNSAGYNRTETHLYSLDLWHAPEDESESEKHEQEA